MKENITRGIVVEVDNSTNSLNIVIQDKEENLWNCFDLQLVNCPADIDIKYNGWEYSCKVSYSERSNYLTECDMHILLINPFKPWNPHHKDTCSLKGLEGILIHPKSLIRQL